MKSRIPTKRPNYTKERSVDKNIDYDVVRFVENYRGNTVNEKSDDAVRVFGTKRYQGNRSKDITEKQYSLIGLIEDYYASCSEHECFEETLGRYKHVEFQGNTSEDAYEFIGNFLDICPVLIHIGGEFYG